MREGARQACMRYRRGTQRCRAQACANQIALTGSACQRQGGVDCIRGTRLQFMIRAWAWDYTDYLQLHSVIGEYSWIREDTGGYTVESRWA